MRRFLVTLLVAGVCASVSPTAAHAGILRYLDELSGPGPFWGPTVELRVRCWKPQPVSDEPAFRAKSTDVSPESMAKYVWLLALTIKTGCLNEIPPNSYPKYSFNIESGYLEADPRNNPITYEDNVPRRVRLIPVEAMFYWQPTLGLELGTGGGFFVFFKTGRYSYVTPTMVLEPMRVDIRPFDAFLRKDAARLTGTGWKMLRSVTIRQSFVYFPNRITADDFGGGPNNTFSERNEVVKSLEIIIDLKPYLTRLLN